MTVWRRPRTAAAYGVPQELKDKAWEYLGEPLRSVLRRWKKEPAVAHLLRVPGGDICGSYYCAAQEWGANTLRLICSSRSTRLTPSRICPIPAMPEIAASAPLERSAPMTWITPRTTSITAVRFSPMW